MIENPANSDEWSRLSHAYGPATDTPIQLENLLSDDVLAREAALEYLVGAVLHQETIYAATAPVAIAGIALARGSANAEASQSLHRSWSITSPAT